MTQRSATSFHIPTDVWIGLLAIAGAGLYWRHADRIPISPLDGQVNAAMLPKTFAVLMIALSILMVVRAVLIEAVTVRAARRLMQQSGQTGQRAAGVGKRYTLNTHLRAGGMLLIGLIFLLILPYLGYVLSVMLLIGSVSVFMGAKADLKTVGVAVGAAVVLYGIFVFVLSIPLPSGFWPQLFN